MMNDQNRKAKLTKNQSLVFEAMLQAGQPMGAYALLDQLRGHGFNAVNQCGFLKRWFMRAAINL